MRWNGKNYRPVLGTGRRSAMPQTYSVGARKMKMVGSIFMGAGETTPSPTPSVEVFITPTGATKYENVILSATTTGTSPTFIWTLTDFYNTGDTQVSSYTGQTLPEGYFTSTGSSNVSVVVSADEGSGSNSTFSVSAFVPTDVSGLQYWWDTTDVSTITFRTGTDYIEQIDDKSGNDYHLIQPTATNQPIWSASTLGSVSAATFDGIDNYIYVDNGVETTPTGRTTLALFISDGDKTAVGQSCNYGGSINQACSSTFYWMTSANGWNSYDGRNIHRALQLSNVSGNVAGLLGEQNDYTTQAYLTGINWSGTPYIMNVASNDENGVANTHLLNNQEQYTDITHTKDFIHRYTIIGSASHPRTTNYWFKMLGEFVEMIHFDTAVSQNDLNKLQRYISYKNFGTMDIVNY